MIKVSDRIRIVREDKLNLALEVLEPKKSRATGEIAYEWKWHGYYSNLETALNAVVNLFTLDLADEVVDDLKTIIARLGEIKVAIKEYVDEVANG